MPTIKCLAPTFQWDKCNVPRRTPVFWWRPDLEFSPAGLEEIGHEEATL